MKRLLALLSCFLLLSLCPAALAGENTDTEPEFVREAEVSPEPAAEEEQLGMIPWDGTLPESSLLGQEETWLSGTVIPVEAPFPTAVLVTVPEAGESAFLKITPDKTGVYRLQGTAPAVPALTCFREDGTAFAFAHTTGQSEICLDVTLTARQTVYVECALSAAGSFPLTVTMESGLPAPVLTGVNPVASGLTLSWNAVEGAQRYRVFWRTTGGWIKAGDTSACSYTFPNPVPGTEYRFTVRCISADGKTFESAYDTRGLTAVWLAAPKLLSAANTRNGVTVTWEAVPDAAQYAVFCKSDGGWVRKAIVQGTSCEVTGLTSGTDYRFTVRCISADGKSCTSSYDTAGIALRYLSAPVLTAVENSVLGLSVRWNAVPGAEKYGIFSKEPGRNWILRAATEDCQSTLTGLTEGKVYYITVRCLSADGKNYTSAYDPIGKSIVLRKPMPQIIGLNNGADGVTVQWSTVPGAEKYALFCKTGSGSWERKAVTAGSVYTVTGLASDADYTFTVRSVSADGKTYTSAYDTAGKTIHYIAAPRITELTNAADGITVTWDSPRGALRYAVFCKTGSGGWVRKGQTSENSYTVTGLTSGETYTFTVRCLSSDGGVYTSGYDAAGKALMRVDCPGIVAAINDLNGVTLRWNPVAGAEKYRVFYRIGTKNWTAVLDTAQTSCTVSGLSSGSTYAFTVRCISADGKRFTSAYNTAGKTLRYIAAPRVTAAYYSASGVTVNWEVVAGADQYRVMYRTGSGSWIPYADTATNSCTIPGLDENNPCYVTVCCISPDGSTILSGFDRVGTPAATVEKTGTYGTSISWMLDARGTLSVTGSGDWANNGFRGDTPWAAYQEQIRKVIIGTGITSVRAAAFRDCVNLTSVSLPSTVSALGADCFSGCTSLTEIQLPAALVTIGDYAFYHCDSLAAIDIPQNVTAIGVRAFGFCASLGSVTVPAAVTQLGTGVFCYSTGLTAVSLRASITELPAEAFDHCTSLRSIVLPASVRTVGASAFSGCESLAAVSMPEEVSSLGTGVFRRCTKLSAVTLPTAIRTVPAYAFDGCTALASIEIPGGVTSIGDYAYNRCTALTYAALPYSLTSIGSYAFSRCTALAELTLPGKLVSIADRAFQRCDRFTGMTIPASVRTIGSAVFDSCGSLANLQFSGSLPTMAEDAFQGLKAFAVYPEGDTSYQNVSAFGGEITWYPRRSQSDTVASGTDGSVYWTLSCNGMLTISGAGAIPDHPGQDAPWVDYISYVTSVNICPGITAVGECAFYGFQRVSSVTIPSTVTRIGKSAFGYCRSVGSFSLPEGLRSIEAMAFTGCYGLTSLTLPRSLQSIGAQAFRWDSSLAQIHFLGKPTQIDANAFGTITPKATCAADAGWSNADKQSYGGLVW